MLGIIVGVYNPFLHESADFGEGFQVCLNPAVLLAFLSDWARASKDKFSGNPARIFPCDEEKDEEL